MSLFFKKIRFSAIFLLLAMALKTVLISGTNASAQSSQEVEYKLKAAYLLNFAKFISWPDSAFASNEAPFIICILGDSPFRDGLLALSGKAIQNRRLEVRYYSQLENVTECHMLFVSSSEEASLDLILESLAQLPMATVSDMPDFVQAGGMVEFIIQEKRLRFAINLDTANRNGLKVNSQLLGLAVRVARKGT